jgi:TP901 family phage tail tape measure protein
MSDKILDEYLLSLGFKVDAASKARFDSALTNANKMALSVAAGIAAAATAVAAATIKIASGLDTLFFTAQRAGTSVKQMEALAYGLQQVGGSAEMAKAAVGGFFDRLRSDPGVEKMLNFKFGIKTRDANGNFRDAGETMMDFVGRLRKEYGDKGFWIARQFAEQAGLSGDTFATIYTNYDKILKAEAEQRRTAGRFGVDPDRAAEKANQLMTRLRTLQMEIGVILDRLAQDLGDKLIGYIDAFARWLDAHQADIVKFVGDVADGMAKTVEDVGKLAEQLKPLAEGFGAFSQQIFGKSGLNVAFELLLGYVAGKWLLGMLGVADKLSLRFVALAAALAWMYHESQIPIEEKLKRGKSNSDAFDQTWFGKMWTGTRDTVRGWFGLGPAGGGPVQKTSTTANGDLPEEARALLDTIAGTEAPGYNVLYGGGTFGSYADHPRQGMRIKSGPNAGGISTAAGRYQFLASTWDAIAKKLGLNDFSPENQDRAAWHLAQEVYKERSGRDLLADLKSPDPRTLAYIGQVLSGTWTSLPGGIEQGQDSGEMARRFNRALASERGRKRGPLFSVPGRYNAPALGVTGFTSPNLSGAGTPLVPRSMPLPGSASSGGFSQSNNITINGAGDPHETARHVESVRRRVDNQLLMNVRSVVQ